MPKPFAKGPQSKQSLTSSKTIFLNNTLSSCSLIHGVMLSDPSLNLGPNLCAWAGFLNTGIFNLHRFDRLSQIRGMTHHVDRVANLE